MLAQQPKDDCLANPAPAPQPAAILADLELTHSRLLSAIQNLAKTTRRPSPDKLEYSAARFRVSQASLARRTVFRAACTYFEAVASTAEQETISRLRQADSDLGRLASQHVSRWSTERVADQWDGYCCASRDMRRALLKQIELERAMLFPLLRNQDSNRKDQIRLIPIDQFLAEESAV